MKSERTRERISPRDFEDYSVQLLIGDVFCSGLLGNISEVGLCVLAPAGVKLEDQQQISRGNILSRYLETPIEFSGKVVWTAPGQHAGETVTLAGIQFDQLVDLPVALTAIGLAASESD